MSKGKEGDLGKPRSVKGYEPILLDSSESVWLVESGSMLVFSASIKAGEDTEGGRKYLFTVAPGDVLFGVAPKHEDEVRVLLAESEGESNLLEITQARLLQLLSDDPSRALKWMEGWVSSLHTALPRPLVPTIQMFSGDQEYALEDGQILQAPQEGVTWVRIHRGNALWMGVDRLIEDPDGGLIPLTPHMWLKADGPMELEVVDAAAVSHPDLLLDGLLRLQSAFLSYVEWLEQQELQEEFQRFQEKERLEHEIREGALGGLGSALAPKQLTTPVSEGPHLLMAAEAVAQALGITINPPAQSEDPEKPGNSLEAIARASHLRMRRVLLTDNWWKQDCGPLIAYVEEDNRPVALLPASARRYKLFDPADKSTVPLSARRGAILAPVAFTFYRPFPETALRYPDLLKFGLKGHTRDLLVALLAGFVATLLGMLTPQATSLLVDNAIPNADRGLLLQIGVALTAASLGAMLFQLTQSIALMRLETASAASTEAATWDRLLKLQPSFFSNYSTGDLLARVSAIRSIRQKLTGATIRTLLGSGLALLNLGLMMYYSWGLALVAFLAALVTIAATLYAGVLTVREARPLQKLAGEISGLMVQLINGISKLRVSGAEERAFAHWGTLFSRLQTRDLRMQHIDDNINVLNAVLPTLISALLFGSAILMIQTAGGNSGLGLTAGTFLAFNAAFGIFIGGATNLSNAVIDVLEVTTYWERAQPIFTAEPEVNAEKADPGRLSGKLSLEHVSFRYQEDSGLILNDVSIRAEPGESIALVGPSGSGKSTTMRLLLGFETPEAGSVYYDDQDLSHLDVHAVRRQLGVVVQHGKIMSGSIFDNISGGAAISMGQAWQAVTQAGFAADIEQMPMGLHTHISEGGTNLSGGQRQRLLISRALVFKPKVLLFDEATSALDNRTQAIVTESLERLNATRVLIAHRLSTIRGADRIYVIAAGRVEQEGTFDELSRQPGLFARLMARQMT